MNKKKRKKKKLVTVLSLVTAFVLCIAATATVTLAYFGAWSTDNDTITLRGGVYLNMTFNNTYNLAYVVPGEDIDIDSNVDVWSGQTTGLKTTDAFLRVKIVFEAVGDVAQDVVFTPTVGTAFQVNTAGDAVWVQDTNEPAYYYLMQNAAKDPASGFLLPIDFDDDASSETGKKNINLDGVITIPTALVNADEGKQYKLTFTYTVIQAYISDAVSAADDKGADQYDFYDTTIAQAKAVFQAVEGYAVTA